MSRRSTRTRTARRLRAPLALGAAGIALALAPGAALAVPSATIEIADVSDRPLATADTIDPGSMTVTNTSTAGERIVSITIDLTRGFREPPLAQDCALEEAYQCEGPAVLPGLAFDPNGGAGDATGKGLTLDSSTGTTGFAAAPEYTVPLGAGFGAVTATFPVDVLPNDHPDDFDAGDSATFSFDADPTSIQGATGPAPAAAIAGAELQGAWVTMTFSDGTTLYNDLSVVPGSETDVRTVLALPMVDRGVVATLGREFGASTRAETPHAEQTLVVSGQANTAGVLVVAEGEIDLTGAPGGGPEPGPLDANALTSVREIPFTIGAKNTVEVPVTLTEGLNVITAYLQEAPGPGPVSQPMVLRMDPTIETDPPTVVSITPAATAAQANRDGIVRIVFSEPIDVGTVSGPYPYYWPFPSGIRITPGSAGEWPDPDYTPVVTAAVPDTASGGTTFVSLHRDIMFGKPRPPIPFAPGQYTVTVRPNVFDVHGNRLAEEVSKTFIVQADPIVDGPPPPDSHQPTPPPPAPAAASGDPVCAPGPPRPAGGESDTVTLGAAQLLISQRIAQAAVRRANAVEAWLEAGIVAGDLCGNAFGPADFAGLSWAGGASNAPVAPTPRPIKVAQADAEGEAKDVTLSVAQLLINQRISQAAVRRVDALVARIDAGLTGGDLADGAMGAGALWTGLKAQSTAPATPVAKSRTIIRKREGEGGRVSVSVAQLRINQRISQAAVRRVNALIDRLQRGLTGAEFKDGSLTVADLAPGARP